MAITLHHKEIMILMTDPNLKVPAQHTSFPFEHPYIIDSAIEQLYQLGYITAVQSKADSHWIATSITSKGFSFLKEEGLI
ncbi:TPA: hypothetical protein ACWS6R_000225 [Klebsiella pneumoniae]|uniref:hypothetical protein n=1 Tax=Klebsiella sp. GG_Kp140 TaxID=3153451 RepID=UPI0032B5F08D|nr:hypothetical protein [Klebsiella pneumoniae]